jgi:hypothetical protein
VTSTSRRRLLRWAAASATIVALDRGEWRASRVAALGPAARDISGTLPAATALGPVSLKTGLVVIQIQFNGTGRLSASLVQAVPSTSGQTPFPLFDRTGPFKASAATLVAAPGGYYAQVSALQACELTFQQPLPETVKAIQQTSLSGTGKDVSAYFTLPSGISTVSLQSTGSSLRAWLYHLDDSGGEAVQGGVAGADGRFFDLAAAGASSSYPVAPRDGGPYLLAVDGVSPSDTWTFAFS